MPLKLPGLNVVVDQQESAVDKGKGKLRSEPV